MRKLEAKHIRKELRTELSKFKNLVREYEEAEEYDKEDLLCAIKKEVKETSAFTAFKRWVLWDNRERYRDLIELCGLPLN